MEFLISQYKEKVRIINEKYLLQYQISFSGEKTPENAEQFLKDYEPKFRRDFTILALETISPFPENTNFRNVIIEKNGLNIVRLHDLIIAISE